jgi:hypothetical protein
MILLIRSVTASSNPTSEIFTAAATFVTSIGGLILAVSALLPALKSFRESKKPPEDEKKSIKDDA